MDFVTMVVAVVVGMWLYNLTKDILYEWKSHREHKQLLRWKRECEKNISTGKEVEKNKGHLETVEKLLGEFYKKYEEKEIGK